jgi:hypothetical protein
MPATSRYERSLAKVQTNVVLWTLDFPLFLKNHHHYFHVRLQEFFMHRFNEKISIAELQISPIEEQPLVEEDDLFNDDVFHALPKSKTHTSWTCVAAGPISSLSILPQQSKSMPLLTREMTPSEIDQMTTHQYWRLYNVLRMQAFRNSTFSREIFCFLETPILSENQKDLVDFLPGQKINAFSKIYWKFFVSKDDLALKAVPHDWRVLSRHASGISSDMIIQPFVSEILKCLYQQIEGFNQFHLIGTSTELCSFSIFSTLEGQFQAGSNMVLLKIHADVVVKSEVTLEFLATVDVSTFEFKFSQVLATIVN